MNSMSNFSLQPGGGGPEKGFPGRRRKAVKSVRSGVASMSPLKRKKRKKELQSFRTLHEFASPPGEGRRAGRRGGLKKANRGSYILGQDGRFRPLHSVQPFPTHHSWQIEGDNDDLAVRPNEVPKKGWVRKNRPLWEGDIEPSYRGAQGVEGVRRAHNAKLAARGRLSPRAFHRGKSSYSRHEAAQKRGEFYPGPTMPGEGTGAMAKTLSGWTPPKHIHNEFHDFGLAKNPKTTLEMVQHIVTGSNQRNPKKIAARKAMHNLWKGTGGRQGREMKDPVKSAAETYGKLEGWGDEPIGPHQKVPVGIGPGGKPITQSAPTRNTLGMLRTGRNYRTATRLSKQYGTHPSSPFAKYSKKLWETGEAKDNPRPGLSEFGGTTGLHLGGNPNDPEKLVRGQNYEGKPIKGADFRWHGKTKEEYDKGVAKRIAHQKEIRSLGPTVPHVPNIPGGREWNFAPGGPNRYSMKVNPATG